MTLRKATPPNERRRIALLGVVEDEKKSPRERGIGFTPNQVSLTGPSTPSNRTPTTVSLGLDLQPECSAR